MVRLPLVFCCIICIVSLLTCLLVYIGISVSNNVVNGKEYKFSDDFKFGVSTSAYQIEGAWNESGKSENIWDRLTHERPDLISDHTNADVTCDSYHKLSDDLALLEWLGVHFYRFSISWSRLLPDGFSHKINEDGVRYYNDLINGLLARNISPMVTLYHWDLPIIMHEIGGWPNVALVDYFEDYARVAFNLFGDRVKMWITFNEPPQMCQKAYGEAKYAPVFNLSGIADYMCGHTLLLAHAQVYHLYDKEFRDQQNGRIGITINSDWYEPSSDNKEDIEAAERYLQLQLGWWAHPIFSKEGDYPAIMKERVQKNSEEENFFRTRLPPFTPNQVDNIRGTADFFGLNYYTAFLAKEDKTFVFKSPSFQKDIGAVSYFDPNWPSTPSEAMKMVPWGLRKLLNWVKRQYNNPEVMITENGYADSYTSYLYNEQRIAYYQQHLQAVLEAINVDECNVTGYSVWSLIDNFEWTSGYIYRYGLFYVDFNSTERTRLAKDAAPFYRSVIENKKIP